MNKQRKNEKGFTMVELVIVVAIMGIIGALLVPAFSTMSAKARLTTDIATVKTLKRTADTYKAEQGSFPVSNGQGLTDLVSILKNKKYLNTDMTFMTGGTLSISGEFLRLNVTGLTAYSDAIDQLASTEQEWLVK